MRIVVMIGMLAIAAAGLAVIAFLATSETLIPPILGSAAVTAAVQRLFLTRFAAHWSRARAVAISAGLLPVLLWLLAFGFDVAGLVQNAMHPPAGFMIGISIMMIPICLMSFGAGIAAALLAGLWRPR